MNLINILKCKITMRLWLLIAAVFGFGITLFLGCLMAFITWLGVSGGWDNIKLIMLVSG